MSNRHNRTGVCLALPLVVSIFAASANPAAAQEPSGMQKFMDAIGLIELPKDPINYRERAPLVVPPSPGLIPPRSAEDISKYNPDWPVDHDNRPGKTVDVDASKRTENPFYSGDRLSPAEMARGRISRAAAEKQRVPEAPRAENDSNRLSPSQLGFKGWGSKKEEQVVFTGEPERRYLTEPPPGLRTPSFDAPYGIVTERPEPKKRDPFDRGPGAGGQ